MDFLSIEIEQEKLISLLEQGVISGADIKVSDYATKELIQETCLKLCIQKMCSECEHHETCMQNVQRHSASQEINVISCQSLPSR